MISEAPRDQHPVDPTGEAVPENETAASPEQIAALAMFDAKLAALTKREKEILGRKNMWLAHHWPDEYAERCFTVGHRHICRRCAALYPLGLLVAVLSASGALPWPDDADPIAIWALSIPATLAYCWEALGFIRYNAKVQVATTLVAAVGFGRALSYEFVERWSPEFWAPIFVFGSVWFLATVIGRRRKRG